MHSKINCIVIKYGQFFSTSKAFFVKILQKNFLRFWDAECYHWPTVQWCVAQLAIWIYSVRVMHVAVLWDLFSMACNFAHPCNSTIFIDGHIKKKKHIARAYDINIKYTRRGKSGKSSDFGPKAMQ